jgi:hypothetical protein
VPLSRSRLEVLAEITRALGEALGQGDLDRAEALLSQRRLALARLDLGGAGEWEGELAEVRALEERVRAICRTWRQALQERLKLLEDGRLLRHSYCGSPSPARFVDVRR